MDKLNPTPGVKEHQPDPTGTGDPVIDRVIADLVARAELSIERYNTPLRTHNGRDALIDTRQELLDGLMYNTQAIMEREDFVSYWLTRLKPVLIGAHHVLKADLHMPETGKRIADNISNIVDELDRMLNK